jgi:hypothetical protein
MSVTAPSKRGGQRLDIKTIVLFAQGGSPTISENTAGRSDKQYPHLPAMVEMTEKYIA